MRQLQFPSFDDIKVSTKTYTAVTNIEIDIQKLFDVIPVTDYVVQPKKRGRKKKGSLVNVNQEIPYGSIVTAKFEKYMKGVELKPKSPKQSVGKNWFRNSITIVMILDKPINFKVCKNGTLQMTGCKNWEHAEMCAKQLWEIVKDDKTIYKFTRGTEGVFQAMIIPSMRNIDFDLGFNVDREKLSKYMNDQNDLHCMMETSFGYTGVNIKIPLNQSRKDMRIDKLTFNPEIQEWKSEWTTYASYLELLDEKTRTSKMKDQKYNTFLVFHSGKVIFSGLTSLYMEPVYYLFVKMMEDAFEEIEERLEK